MYGETCRRSGKRSASRIAPRCRFPGSLLLVVGVLNVLVGRPGLRPSIGPSAVLMAMLPAHPTALGSAATLERSLALLVGVATVAVLGEGSAVFGSNETRLPSAGPRHGRSLDASSGRARQNGRRWTQLAPPPPSLVSVAAGEPAWAANDHSSPRIQRRSTWIAFHAPGRTTSRSAQVAGSSGPRRRPG